MAQVNLAPRFNNSNRFFYTEVKKRVDAYFKEHQLSKNANVNMYVKTVFMFTVYFVPYFLILFQVIANPFAWLFFSVVMGLAMSGIGLCVMHDANHGSYSKSTRF